MKAKLYDEDYLQQIQVILKKTATRGLELLSIAKEDKIADIGCGTGILTNEISLYGVKVIGIDNDENFINIAKSQYSENPNVTFIHTNAHNTNLPSNYIDKVIIYRVLQHIDNHEEVIKECYRILKPGGTIQIIEPDYLSCTFFCDSIDFERKLLDRIVFKRLPNSFKIRQIAATLKENNLKLNITEVHNYIIKSYEQANFIINFNEEIENGFNEKYFSINEYTKWQEIKNLPDGQFNLSVNLLLYNSRKL